MPDANDGTTVNQSAREVLEVVGVQTGADEGLHGVEQEARRHALGGAAQVAAREQQHALVLRGRDGGEEACVIGVDPRRRAGGSTPFVARRSVSGSSESSRTRAGNVPSAMPHRNTRSRSRPRPSATCPMRMPSPSRPTRPRSSSSWRVEGAAEHVEAGWALDRVEAGEALERGVDLVGGLLLGLGPARRRGTRADVVAHETLRPRDELTPRGARGRAARARSRCERAA